MTPAEHNALRYVHEQMREHHLAYPASPEHDVIEKLLFAPTERDDGAFVWTNRAGTSFVWRGPCRPLAIIHPDDTTKNAWSDKLCATLQEALACAHDYDTGCLALYEPADYGNTWILCGKPNCTQRFASEDECVRHESKPGGCNDREEARSGSR